MRSVPVWIPSLLLTIGFMAGGVSAAPTTADLAFDGAPVLAGAVSASGGGEVPLDANVPANLVGTGVGLTLTRVWTEETVVAHPLGGGDVSVQAPQSQREDVAIDSGAFTLGGTGDDFRGLLFTDDNGRLEATAHHLDAAPLVAFRAPQLVMDDYDQTREGEEGIFTYQADGDRFPVLLDAVAVHGGFTTFLYDAQLVVTDANGTQARYTSGTTREPIQPGTFRVTHEHHLLHITNGSATVEADTVLTWLQDPTFRIDGSLRAQAATGRVDIQNEAHTLDRVPVALVGTFELRPVPEGDPVPVSRHDGLHVGSSQPSEGRYSESRGFFTGDITSFAIGGQQFIGETSDLALTVAGVVGITGLALLFVPNVKWGLAGLIAPLYAKTRRDRLLDNDSRERIFQVIRSNPGINLSQIHRVVDLGWGVTVYHLKMMEKNDLVVSETNSRDRCFFENDPRLIELRNAIATIANRPPVQRIVQSVVDHPGLNQGEVIAATGLTQRTVSYYLGRLAKKGLVDARRVKNFVHYEPTEHLCRALDVVRAPGAESVQVEANAAAPVHA